MDNSLKQWFSHRFLDLFQSQTNHYRTSVILRLIPTFSRIEDEAAEFERREVERIGRQVAREMDYGDFTQIIHDRSIEYYLSLAKVRQGMVNLFTAGLYHLFEQQVTQFATPSKPLAGEKLFACFADVLNAHRGCANELPHWQRLTTELRLVANTVKHGPGDSADKLAELRQDLFVPKYLRGVVDCRGDIALSPVVGEGLFLEQGDFEVYADAIIEFWNAFSCWPMKYSGTGHEQTE